MRLGGGTAIAGGGAGICVLLIACARRQLLLVHVRGASMEPTLPDGSTVLAMRRRADALRRGDVVVFAVPSAALPEDGPQRLLVKRIIAVAGDAAPESISPEERLRNRNRVPDGHLVVEGDNARSQTARALGFVAEGAVVGVVRRPWRMPRS